MTRERFKFGQEGEQKAQALLLAKGYRLLDRGFRCVLGEIDLVMRDQDTIVFIEVKNRSSRRFGGPEEAVGPRKQRKLVRLAQAYLIARRLENRPVRFDVVAVLGEEMEHFVDAFRP